MNGIWSWKTSERFGRNVDAGTPVCLQILLGCLRTRAHNSHPGFALQTTCNLAGIEWCQFHNN
jgi:hypothetical protein